MCWRAKQDENKVVGYVDFDFTGDLAGKSQSQATYSWWLVAWSVRK